MLLPGGNIVLCHDYRFPVSFLQGGPVIDRRGSRGRRWRIGKGFSTRRSTCPHCNSRNRDFPAVCPVCGRPFMRDYIDWRMHPRDPDLTGTFFHDPSWARFWLFALVVSLLIPLQLPF